MLILLAHAHAVTLEEAWAAAAKNSLDLGLVHESTLQTETLRGQAAALISPKLVLGGNYTYNEYEIAWDPSEMIPEEFAALMGEQEPIVFQKKSYFDANISVIQPLFSGQALPAFQAANAMIRADRSAEVGIKGQVKAGVAKAYYGLAVAREGERVAQAALDNAKKHVDIVQQQLTVGVAPPTARLQADIAMSRAQRSVAEAHEGVVKAGEAFKKLTGLPEDAAVELPPQRELPYTSVDEVLDRAAKNRPEILTANQRVIASQRSALATNMGWFPTVDGRFTWSWTQNNVGFNDDPTFWQFVVTADWVLWDGGFRLANGQKSASQVRQARLALEKAEADAGEQVRTLWSTRQKAAASLDTVEHEAVLAEENLRIAEVAFGAGGISFLELEDARLGLLASKMSVLNERMQRDLATIDLLAATGDL